VVSFQDLFGNQPVLAILRGLPPAEAAEVAGTVWDSGVELLEVTIGDPGQLPALAAVVAAGAERGRLVGAGTVITPEQVRAAAQAGARYTVAPGFDPAVLAVSLAAGMPHLPGTATGTEVQRAHLAGCRWVKSFPAIALGPDWFRAIRGPFPDVRYVATGGMSADTAAAFLDAGADVIGIGHAAFTESASRERLTDLVKRRLG
jgi:Entner-Doudoroff aldolase